VDQGNDESDVTFPADTVMSIGGSCSTDGSPEHSTCGSSVSASESRKRAADESPDREYDVSSRCEFPGRVTRSAAGCRVYIPLTSGDKDDYLGSVLNDDGTFAKKVTLGQENESVTESGRGILPISNEPTGTVVPPPETPEKSVDTEIPAIVVPASTVFSVAPVPDLHVEPTDMLNSRSAVMPTADNSSRADLDPD